MVREENAIKRRVAALIVVLTAARFFKAPELFAALFAILLLGFAFDRVLRLIRARVLVWLQV